MAAFSVLGVMMMATLMSNYARLPVTFKRGEGAWLWDSQNKRYLDALSGIAVCSLGHAHPAVTRALCEQAGTLMHTSNLYQIEHQQALADALTARSGMSSAFFCNSGAEANEAAIKLSRLYARQRGITHPKVIVAEGSFHGRTMATLSATGNHKIRAGFEPLVADFVHLPYNDLAAIQQLTQDTNVVAVLLEPIQGEGGIIVPHADYLTQVRRICDQQQWLFMLDEIQAGMGRTGHWFGYQQHDFFPDVITVAKALGNGFPIGACLARGAAAELFQPGHHGSTFGGNPLGCRLGLTVIEAIEQAQLLPRAAALGQYLLQGFQQQLATVEGVRAIRGRGLMIGIELTQPCAPLVQAALDQQLLINVTAGNTIRLLPPLIISDEQADFIISTVSDLVTRFLAHPVAI